MNNELKIQHDTSKKCESIKQKFRSLLDVVDINDFFEKSLDFLSLFKSIIDNNPNIRKNFKKDVFVMYVINLRNYQQHHEERYKETIENNSHINIHDYVHVDSNSTVVINNCRFDGISVPNLEVSSGRTLNMDGGDSLERRFKITNPFNFSYKFQKQTIYGYDKTPPAHNFYDILYKATVSLIGQMKKKV